MGGRGQGVVGVGGWVHCEGLGKVKGGWTFIKWHEAVVNWFCPVGAGRRPFGKGGPLSGEIANG